MKRLKSFLVPIGYDTDSVREKEDYLGDLSKEDYDKKGTVVVVVVVGGGVTVGSGGVVGVGVGGVGICCCC